MPDWQEIVDRDGKAVWQTVYRIVGHQADADECFQEAFLAAWEVSRREQVQNWRALLMRLGAARAVDRLRQRHRHTSRQKTADWDTVASHEPTPSQSAEDSELSEQLRISLARLAPRHAEIFCLHCLEGFSYQEIADQLAITANSVGVLLHRARKQLRLLLDTYSGARRAAVCDSHSTAGPQIARKERS
jgi:RNA polymerase sigma-70 factor, ECF subfamily